MKKVKSDVAVEEDSNRKLIILIMVLVGVGFVCLACQQFEDENKIKDLEGKVSSLEVQKGYGTSTITIPKKNEVIAAQKATDSDEMDYKIELTSSGNVVVNTQNIKNKVVATNVAKAVKVNYGSSNACEKFAIVSIKNDGSITAFDLSDTCEYDESVINNYDLSQFSDVVNVYNTVEAKGYNTLNYNVVIQKSDYTTEDITQYIEK